jgi:hypothetical protein
MVFACCAIARTNEKQKTTLNLKTKITEMPAEFMPSKGGSWSGKR